MEWFTAGWHSGELEERSPGATDEVRDAYWVHVDRLSPRMPASVRQLATAAVLHDGQFQSWGWEGGTLRVQVLVGDLQVGYSRLELEYASASVRPEETSEQDLAASNVELLYDEVAVAPDGRWEHRLLLWPYREVDITFEALSIRNAPAVDGDRRFDT